jgi:ABC-type dipeptide/oligopeptide/nickel transport system ATPase component
VFHTRCPRVRDICKTEIPRLSEYPNGHVAACHFAGTPLPETPTLVG